MAASVKSTGAPWTTWARWLCTSAAEMGSWELEILKQRREVVVSEMPNRRNDSVIFPFVQPHKHKRAAAAGPGRHTLLFGLRQKTTSEWTFLVRSFLVTRKLWTAWWTAART